MLRPHHQSRSAVLRALTRVLPLLKTESLRGKLWIVEEHRVRIREEGAD